MTTPEFDLAAEFAAQTLGSQSMVDLQPELNDYLKQRQLGAENKIKKAILKTYLATPIEKRGKLDFEAVVSKMANEVVSKDARKPWAETKHPRNLYGQFIDKLGIEHSAFKKMPRVKTVEAEGQARINNRLPFKIVRDERTPQLPERFTLPTNVYTEEEANKKIRELNEQLAESHRNKLKGMSPEEYLKEVYGKTKPTGGRIIYSGAEPVDYERGSAAVVSDLLGVLRIPQNKDKTEGRPVHNLAADISTMAARGIGEAKDSDLAHWMKSKSAGEKALKAGAFLSGVFDHDQNSKRTKALVDFAEAYGEDAGKQLTKYYYRYSGLSRPGGPDVNLTRGRDARGKKIDEGSDQGYRRRLYADLANRLPDHNAATLSRQAGSIPPSEGFVVASHGGTIPLREGKRGVKYVKAEGQLLHQALGRAPDHYLPFNMSHLTGLKGGGWSIRRRQWGGPTTEDLHMGLLTGASGVGVVSRHGVYEIEFTDLMKKAKNRMGPDHIRMVNRYESLLKAIKDGKVTDERGTAVRLNHQGYSLALEALKSEFPWFIKSVEHVKSSPNAMKSIANKAVWKTDKIADDDETDASFASRADRFEHDVATDRAALSGRSLTNGVRQVAQQAGQAAREAESTVRQHVDNLREGHYQPAYGGGWGSVTDAGPEGDIGDVMDRFLTSIGEETSDPAEAIAVMKDHADEFGAFLDKELDKTDRFINEQDPEPDATQTYQNERVAMDQEAEFHRSLVRSLDSLSNYDPENFTTGQIPEIEKHLRGAHASILALGANVRKTQVDQWADFKSRYLKTMREGNPDYDV